MQLPTNDPIAKLNADIEELRRVLMATERNLSRHITDLKIELDEIRVYLTELKHEVRNATANDA